MKDTVLLIGNSPFLKTVEDKIEYVLNRYHSIGINNIIQKYKTTEHIFQDFGIINITNKYPDIKTVSLYTYGDLIQKDNKELINSYSFDFDRDTKDDLYREGTLAWCGFTHDYALSYCVYKGWKQVILIGVADYIEGGHFVVDGTYNYSDIIRRNSTKFINEIVSQRINILTCNPESPLDVERISIDDLLK